MKLSAHLLLSLVVLLGSATGAARVRVSEDGRGFELEGSGEPFRPWGVNYDHDEVGGGRLLESYWEGEWPVVVEDLREIRALGANVVRVHLQVGAFMEGEVVVKGTALKRLARLLEVAEALGLYLDVTGLGCYHREEVPAWYTALGEERRWAVQARFWEAVAKTCAGSPAVFCYNLMNEPVVPGKKVETDWLAGEFGGKTFVQRIALDLGGRPREEVVEAWVGAMVGAIRKHDERALVTVGVIPWALTFPGAKPVFYGEGVRERLDFVSVHVYPRKDESDGALRALEVYQVGMPVVVEEVFPLKCGAAELEAFMRRAEASGLVQGWVSFYWGKTAEEYGDEEGVAAAIKAQWLERFAKMGSGG